MTENSIQRQTLNNNNQVTTHPNIGGTKHSPKKKDECRDFEETYVREENCIGFSSESRLENSQIKNWKKKMAY